MAHPWTVEDVARERDQLRRDDPAGERDAIHPLSDGPKPTFDLPKVDIFRVGPSYRVVVTPLIATLTFRDVRTSGELSADVAVAYRGRHLFRTTSTLSLAGREKIAKVAAELSSEIPVEHWRRGVFAAVEAIIVEEENLGAPVDLRSSSTEMPHGGTHVMSPLWPTGSMVMVSPGAAGKSTIARALAVSLASGAEVIPGLVPAGPPRPVLFVAAEDPVAHWHTRSVEAICRGAMLDRCKLPQPIELFDARGRPLHRIARAVAERAADFGAVILDSQQALLGPSDNGLGIRDRDTLFWSAIDQLGPPVCLIAHPNRADAKGWEKADGRIAGSEVNADRARMAWRVAWKDEPSVTGTSFRRYTLENTKNSHGPKVGPLTFAASWTYGMGDDAGVLTFEAVDGAVADDLSSEYSDTLAEYRSGNTSYAVLASKLGVPIGTVKRRLHVLREKDLL